MHKTSDELEFRPDYLTTELASLECSFLIESSSKLLVTRTGIKIWTSWILGGIRPLILELHVLALE